ncbi:cupredoxin domain-containing protein [Ovoidimarina sediminis]|uniref:cupredoxin domain-containing protein n=1 Tax=Ovoidimarina sediminis TaxID=3079856 RepID=UPI0029112893|nr:cupredoxin family copper-binding protein [Rhodophyticola sp. MJ-SS7]MDU8944050.1 cupredoxin family copper-binding protein [Rhodophyticola sp. MJ-SS7]
MRRLTPQLSRRRFGQGLGASLALPPLPRAARAHDDPHVVIVRMSRFAFVPATVEIRPGDEVIWVNDDLVPHTATAREGDWETDTLEAGASGRIAFADRGTFAYVCAFHPHMTGTVAVRSG